MSDVVRTESGSVVPVWAGYVGMALLVWAFLRWSINYTWDGWCTALAVLGAAGVAAWAIAGRSAIGRSVRSRGMRFGAQTVLSGILVLALLGAANFIASRHNARVDLTEAGLFTLSSQTRQVLRKLPTDVHLYAFFPSARRAQAADMLRRYSEESPRLRYDMIDPDQDPDTAKRYGVTAYGTVVVQAESAGKPGQPIKVEADPQGRRQLALSEEKLTNALLKVVRGGAKTLYFLQGHGEGDLSSQELNGYSRVREALANQGFVVKTLLLARKAEVPEDCSVLVIAGPASEPLPGEMAAVQKYLEHGGKLLALIDPPPAAGLEKFLADWGILASHEQVMDPSAAGRMYGARPEMPLVTDYDAMHPITKSFHLQTIFPLVRPVAPSPRPGDATPMPFAQTSPSSIAVPRGAVTDRGSAKLRHGPFVIATTSARQTKDGKEARIAAIGSSNFISNAFFDKAGNGDLFLNTVNWLAEEESLIAIRPKAQQDHRVTMTEQQVRGFFWLTVVALPVAPLVLGTIVYWRRR